MSRTPTVVLALILLGAAAGRAGDQSDAGLDRALRLQLARWGVGPLDPGPAPEPARVRLGQALFFDRELSGNRDTSCATCHHPSFATGDARSLGAGTGGVGLGPGRVKGADRLFIPRDAPEVFNRGATDWTTMFWDMRVFELAPGALATPAGAALPEGLDGVLAAQAMFPVTGRDEMRGDPGDPSNELATIDDADLPAIWSALMVRLRAIPEYIELFAAAYPGVPAAELGFEHAANAIGAFEVAAFTRLDSPWDRFLAGDGSALSFGARRGALLFLGKAGCVQCHSGRLMTDQRAHNLAVPQLGPGKPPESPRDFGFNRVSHDPRDRYAFRTPPLRNVAVTGPWMHNGAYTTLEGAIRHHLDPPRALLSYDPSQLDPELRGTVLSDRETLAGLLATLDPLVARPTRLNDGEVADLLEFLGALTSPSLPGLDAVIPDAVPSGLPVDRLR